MGDPPSIKRCFPLLQTEKRINSLPTVWKGVANGGGKLRPGQPHTSSPEGFGALCIPIVNTMMASPVKYLKPFLCEFRTKSGIDQAVHLYNNPVGIQVSRYGKGILDLLKGTPAADKLL